jgi:ribosomal protein S15P/S13E
VILEPIRDWTSTLEQAKGLEMEWVSVQEASWRLRISPSTVRRWLASDKLNGRIMQNGRRASYAVQVPALLANLSQAERVRTEVLRAQLATREQQLAVLTRQNERLERHLDAARRRLSLHSRRRIAESEAALSKARGLARWLPFLRLLQGRHNTG